MNRAWGLLILSGLLSACLEHLPASLPSAALGTTDDIPIEPVAGRASSVHFFGWRRFGDDTTEAALKNARKGKDGDGLINVLVNRKILCFPACDWPFVTWSETSVEGTLVRYKRMPTDEKIEPILPARLPAGQPPQAEALVERLMHIYLQEPQAASEFYLSLSNETRHEIAEHVLSKKGLLTQGGNFLILKSTTPQERKFLVWFVAAYTTYQPLDQ